MLWASCTFWGFEFKVCNYPTQDTFGNNVVRVNDELG
jgi:hypothetical protein